jgi:hypothetical protein
MIGIDAISPIGVSSPLDGNQNRRQRNQSRHPGRLLAIKKLPGYTSFNAGIEK